MLCWLTAPDDDDDEDVCHVDDDEGHEVLDDGQVYVVPVPVLAGHVNGQTAPHDLIVTEQVQVRPRHDLHRGVHVEWHRSEMIELDSDELVVRKTQTIDDKCNIV